MSVTEPRPSQRGHMPPVMLKLRRSLTVLPAALERDRARAADRGDVEGERLGRADVRLPEPAEQDAQHRVGVGGGADRGAGVGAHPLLVDDDRGGQPVEHVDVGPRQRRHEALHEGAVGLVDQPLRLGGDRAEHQRALARAGDAGEHRQPALRDLDADVLEVVHARAVHADQVVAVGGACARAPLRRRLRGRVIGLPRSRSRVSAARWMRIMVARGVAEGAVADAVRLLGRLLDDLGVAGLQPLEGAVEVRGGQDERGVGALGHHLGDGAALVVGDAGVGGRRVQDDGRAGLVGRADRDPAHPAVADVVADLEAEGVAVEGQRGLRVVVREEGRVNGDVHGGHARCGSRDRRFSIPDRSGHLLRHARRHPRRRAAPPARR